MEWSQELENGVNEHINAEYSASYEYHSMFNFFRKNNVSLFGLSNFFEKQYKEEQEHANEFMKYQLERGGSVKLLCLKEPKNDYFNEKGEALYAMELALEMEKNINNKLLELHDIASRFNDFNFCDFIEKYLEEQVKSIYQISNYVTQLKRVGNGLGVFVFDQSLCD
jgi:ferritin heavy chain